MNATKRVQVLSTGEAGSPTHYRIKVTNPRRPGAAYYAHPGFLSCPDHATAWPKRVVCADEAYCLRAYLSLGDEVAVEKF